MPRTRRIRIAAWPLRILSVMTLMALMVAPSGAPLCAAKSCGGATAWAKASGGCHGAGTVHHEALLVHGIRNCSSPELPAVVSTSTALGGDSGVSRASAPGANYTSMEPQNSTPNVPFSDNHLGRSPDSLSSFVSVPTSVLRI